MADLVQVVASKPDGELPVGLTAFLPLPDAAKKLGEFREHGYGSRQATRPTLSLRAQDGRTIDPPAPPAPAKKKTASSSD